MAASRRGYQNILAQQARPEPMFQLGCIAQQEGNLAQAAKWFRQAIKLNPSEPALWRALASITKGGARDKLRRQAGAVGITLPSEADELVAKGDERIAQGDRAGATHAYRAAIKAGGKPVAILTHMGQKLAGINAFYDALRALEKAVQLAPTMTSPRLARATLKQTMGMLEDAGAELRDLLTIAPGNGAAWLALIRGQRQNPGSADMAALEEQWAKGIADPEAKRLTSYALAKGLEDQGRDAKVFAHLDRANAMTARRFPYSFDRDLKTARRRLALADTGVFDGHDGPAPIFVVGLPRSGTTLLETMLAAHPNVTPGGELGLFTRTVTPLADQNPVPDAAAWQRAGAEWMRLASARTGNPAKSTRITDKSISTFSIMGPVARALPRAKFVLLGRDQRDIGFSIYKNHFPDGQHRYASNLREIGRYIRLFEAVTTAWTARLPGRVHSLSYEALIDAPEATMRACLAFCDLPWEPACASPEGSHRAIKTLSVAQARQPITCGSVARWRRFKARLQPLIEALETDIAL
ncbi:MAG: sulfotransferase [Rhodobacteraceae bacterium]|nr:sulfotransferase [Paracoccaceae bacterium]